MLRGYDGVDDGLLRVDHEPWCIDLESWCVDLESWCVDLESWCVDRGFL